MAPGAPYGQPEERRARGRDDVIHLVVGRLLPVDTIDIGHSRSGREKSCKRQGQRVITLQGITSNLPACELIKRHALIERANNRITIRPSRRPLIITFITVTFTKTCDIKPVPSPAFPVMGAGKEPRNHFCISIRRFARNKIRDLRTRGGKACQVKVNPANQRGAISRGVWRNAFLPDLGQHEMINSIPSPLGALKRRHLYRCQRAESPVFRFLSHPGDAQTHH